MPLLIAVALMAAGPGRAVMEANAWTRAQRISRRGFIGGGLAASAALLAACSSTRNSKGKTTGASGRSSTAAATGTPQPVRGGTLTVRMPSDVSLFDYAYEHDGYSNFVLQQAVEPLLTHTPDAKPTGLLATSWENPDDRTYIFHLRQGVTFQDGASFNADAVDYSMGRIRADKASFQYQNLTFIDTIEKPDQNTVKITLSSPFAPFLESLTGDAGRVISPAIAEKYGKAKLATDLTNQGSGPFKFGEWVSGDHVTLVRNEAYWGKDSAGSALPYLDKLLFRVIPDENAGLASLRNGEVDSFQPGTAPPPKDTASVKADASLRYRVIPALGYQPIYFNEQKDPFGHKEVRQAIAYALDRTPIASNVLFDTVVATDVIFNQSIWAYEPGYHPYLKRDVAKAKQLLAQAGKPNGFSFSFLIATGSPAGQQWAELIKDQVKEAGIDMTIQELDFPKQITAVTAGDYEAATIGWGPNYDPDNFVYSHFSTKGPLNARTHYNNPTVDALIDQARTTLDTDKRKPLYQQIQQIVIGDDAVFCIVYNTTSADVTLKKVQNYPLGPLPVVGLSQVWKTA
jgi:peptide/nickel transport system substrate-binding protein